MGCNQSSEIRDPERYQRPETNRPVDTGNQHLARNRHFAILPNGGRTNGNETSSTSDNETDISSVTDPNSEFSSEAQRSLRFLKRNGLRIEEFRVLGEPDYTYNCHAYTFFNGPREQGDLWVSPKEVEEYIKKYFKRLGKKDDFDKKAHFYEDLAKKLEKNRDSCIVVFRNSKGISHTSPILEVYQKEDGKPSIRLQGKFGNQLLGIHDIGNMVEGYGKENWTIYFTDREKGRIMDE